MLENRYGVTADLCRQLLRYDRETGRLFWLPRDVTLFRDGAQSAQHNCNAWNGKCADREAFYYVNPDGYRQGAIFNRRYTAHRVIWLMHHGYWASLIDHIDGDRLNNRIGNLRRATVQENGRNMATRDTSISGRLGVTLDKARACWRARIFDGERDVFLGRFMTLDDAVAAREMAERRLGYHPNHGRPQ